MMDKARAWLAAAGTTVAGMAMVAGLTSPSAVAEPVPTPPPAPATDGVVAVPGVAPAAPAGLPQAGAPVAPPAGVVPLIPSAAAPLTPAAGTLPPVTGAGTPQLGPNPAAAVPTTAAPGLGTPPAAAQPRLVPATSGTLRDYFASKNVTLEPQRADGFKALNITLPMPRGWSTVPDPNVPDAFVVIADRVGGDGLYTNNAQLVVYKLAGEFDPWEAITHGFVDSQGLPAWRTTAGSMGDLGGMPSTIIEGTYRQNDMTLNTSRRNVIATVGPDKYLLTLTVTTPVSQIVASGNATDAIVKGFRVVPPTAAPAPGAPAPAAPAAGAPAVAQPAAPAPAAPAAPAPAAAVQAPSASSADSAASAPAAAPAVPVN